MCQTPLVSLFFVVLQFVGAHSILGQSHVMPREDVIEFPAVGEGFCFGNVFQSSMVLQRSKLVRVWGWSDPGQRVTVEFAGQSVSTTVDVNRSWLVELAPMDAESVGQTLTAQCGDETLVLDDVLVGDVWLLGGQSNMEFELAKVENGNLEIISANYPEIRVLTVPYGQGPTAAKDFPRLHQWSDWSRRHFRKGDWNVCSPDIARELSAIGFVFARRIHQASQIPIGVIDASRGGTTVETWTPIGRLREMKSVPTQNKLAEFDQSVEQWDAEQDLADRISKHDIWVARQRKEGKEIPEDRKFPPADLRPGPIGNHNFPGHCYAGMIAPLQGLSIKGAIFHQGYNNAFDGTLGAMMYQDVFPVMIDAWREAFADPELPFGILSLCTDGYPQTLDDYCEKMFNGGIDIRAAQYETFLDFYQSGDQNLGFVSTYDLRRRWYHPQLKLPAGERIARWALSTQYDFDGQIQWKPPMLVEMTHQDGALVLKLDTEVSDPMDGEILGFAIAGIDRQFHPAKVTYGERGKNDRGQIQYDRRQLVLTSAMVNTPVHFRYAWGRNPLANLQVTGHKDLPFATQRSDDWPMEKVPLGVLDEGMELPISRADRGKILQALRKQDLQRRLHEATELLRINGEKGGLD